MTVKIQIACDGCGHIVEVDSGYCAFHTDIRMGALARNFSFFEMPDQKHLCFECAIQVLRSDDEPAGPEVTGCAHEWVNADGDVFTGAEVCTKCLLVRTRPEVVG